MAQSLSCILIHLVFSTKNRFKWIDSDIETQLHRYLAVTCQSLGCPALRIGGYSDHIHILLSLKRTMTISKIVEKVKTGSSKWIKTKARKYCKFAWQNGYGAFSIGTSATSSLKQYISNQRDHHRARSFMEEFRALLEKHDVTYDEQFMWD